MGLVDNDRIVGIQIAVMGGLRQQDAIGHKLDDTVLIQFFAEPDLVTH